MKIWIDQSVLTRPLIAGFANMPGAKRVESVDSATFVVTETARFAAYPHHQMHLSAGISVRDRGVITFSTSIRADELEDPAIWIRTETATAELVARATLQPFFGFRPSRWVAESTGDEAGVVTDEIASLMPVESGFREDLSRAWFVLTGMPLVTHLLAVPAGGNQDEIAAVAEWVESGGRLDESDLNDVIAKVVEESGADSEEIAELITGMNWTLTGDERVSAAELFVKSRVASGVGPIPWRLES